MTKTLYATKGLPASGKSTWARQKAKELKNCKLVSKDDLRAMLDDGKWSRENEKFVLKVRDSIVTEALKGGSSVIVHDTNLAGNHLERLKQLAESQRAEFVIQDFTHVSLEECIRRDQKRPNWVGEKVIRDMWYQSLAPKPLSAPEYDPTLPSCFLCDVDGTVAEMNGRGPFEWDKVGADKPRKYVIGLVRSLVNCGYTPIFMSGRDGVSRSDTGDWLRREALQDCGFFLYTREAGDMRKDSIVKRELYERHILGKYNVVAVIDDRAQVCRTWTELGLGDRLFRVGPVDRDDF